MILARYDLRQQSATFEFFCWLVLVAAKGATHVLIDKSNPKTSKIPRDMVMQRVDSILIPGIEMAGMRQSGKNRNADVVADARDIRRWVKEGKTFPRLRAVKKPVAVEYTVTLRKNPTAKCRDSNDAVWRQFAKEIGAILIEDYSVKPIYLHDRFALYAGAKMNFGVCNGPVAMIGLTPYPMRMFVQSDSARGSQRKDGIEPGGQFPWLLEHQRLVWKEDTIDNLRAEMETL